MTTVNSVGSTRGMPPIDPQMRQRMDKVFSAVADKLGMSTDDLKTQLQSGKNLTDVAAAKGVSKDDLLATVKGALGSGGSDQMAKAIVDMKPPTHQGRHGHGAGAPPQGPPPGGSSSPFINGSTKWSL